MAAIVDIKKKTPSQTGKGLLKDILFVIFIYLMFTSFGYAAFHIPSGSMEPTLEVGDRLFVSKFAYGYNKFSVPFDPEIVGEDKIFESSPKRGDIVVFTLDYLERFNKDYIKRLVGMPGDRIEMQNGRLFINGDIIQRDFIRTVKFTNYKGYQAEAREYTETLPGGVKHRIYEYSDKARLDNFGPFTIPEDHYFMMGDNRDDSADSRELGGMGPVHKRYLVGRAEVTSFSLYDCDQGKDISCFWGIPIGRFFVNLK